MDPSTEKPKYISYLLRFWPGHVKEGFVWRASLENTLTGDRMGFPDLEELFSFLETTLQDQLKDDPLPPDEETQ